MKNESTKKIIEDALARGTRIVGGNGRALQKIRDLGIDVPNQPRIVPWEEFVEKYFSNDEKNKALARAKRLPALPPDLSIPSVILLYREILKCIILGMNGAAITLSSILVEYMLKFSTYKIEMGGFQKYDPEKWDEFEATPFQRAIARAYTRKLIDEELKTKLENFKDQIRNPYLHYNIKKITKNVILKNAPRVNLISGEMDVSDRTAVDDPTVQPRAKKFVDEDKVLDIFRFANNFVTEMWSKISHLE